MKILHTVQQYPPETSGMAKVVQELSERMVVLGHDVTVATTPPNNLHTNNPITSAADLNGVKLKYFNLQGNLARGITGEYEKYKKFLIKNNFDIITNFAAQQPFTDVMLPILDKIKAKKVFVPTGFSALFKEHFQEYFGHMPEWMRKYDMNIFLSGDYRDINFAKMNNVKNFVIIPNGASEEEFAKEYDVDIRKKLRIPKDNFLVLHVGSFTGEKGHKEAMQIFMDAKIKNSTLLMIGKKTIDLEYQKVLLASKFLNLKSRIFGRKSNILTLDLPRDETIQAFKQSDLFLFPSNIECSPLVIFESLAAGLPFLATNVGNVEEIIKWTNAGKILPTWKNNVGKSIADTEASAKILKSLYEDKELRKELGQNGKKAFKEKFTWEKITKQYEELYKKLLT